MNIAVQNQARPPFTVHRVTGTLGAEISGVDLSKPLSKGMVQSLSDELVQHKVIFFRDQSITTEQHIAFAKQFGPLEVHPLTEGSKTFATNEKNKEVIVIESTAATKSAADVWHSDVTWRVDPSLGSILRCTIAPAYGGDTLFADMEAAYAGLDDATRNRLSGLVAVHDWHKFREFLRADGVSEERIQQLVEQYPMAEHPVVRTHPVSGRKCIYVNKVFTKHIKGMSDTESRELLEKLYALASVPGYQVRFRWEKNSIAFWDNRSTQHYAVPDFYPQHRRMERVTIAGDRPF